MTEEELVQRIGHMLRVDDPPGRECDCDYPEVRYRNGSGHDPGCPVHWWYLEDKRPGSHAADARTMAAVYIAESGGNPNRSQR